MKDVQPRDEVEILTGLGKTFLSLDDITQATEVSNIYLLVVVDLCDKKVGGGFGVLNMDLKNWQQQLSTSSFFVHFLDVSA